MLSLHTNASYNKEKYTHARAEKHTHIHIDTYKRRGIGIEIC